MKALKGYMLTVLGPEKDEKDVEVVLSGRVLGDAEDVINDALPEGYEARITEAMVVRP
jgi:hypothetical protein